MCTQQMQTTHTYTGRKNKKKTSDKKESEMRTVRRTGCWLARGLGSGKEGRLWEKQLWDVKNQRTDLKVKDDSQNYSNLVTG